MRLHRYGRACQVYQQTSRDAWASVRDAVSTIDAAILRVIVERDGATGSEIELATGLKHQTVSAQIRHMVEGTLLEASGQRRRNTNNRLCIVWQLAPRPSDETPAREGLF